MSGRKILLLAVFMNIYLIQAEVMHGVEIPDLDVKRALGKWYVVFGPSDDTYIACVSLTVEQPSKDAVKLTAKVTPTPEGVARNRSYENEPLLAPMTCKSVENSHILECTNAHSMTVALVVFDIDYDVYMAAYLGVQKDSITANQQADLWLLSRTLTLPNKIVDQIKNTDFYVQKNFPHYEIFHPAVNC